MTSKNGRIFLPTASFLVYDRTMPLTFEKTPIPVITYGVNPYYEAVKSIIKGDEALNFVHTIDRKDRVNAVRQEFDKIKRELQTAGSMNDVTVRSHIYDNADYNVETANGPKFVLPAAKGSTLELRGSKKDPEKVTELRVVFWVTDKIVREGPDEEDDTEE